MPRVFIKHKTGSKAHQIDMLDFIASREVLVGRDQACALAYDEQRDETVSRRHAKITQNSGDPNLFTIENFSRNGTFVDGYKIDRPTPLSHGSTVRFGLSGPSFIFEIDPPPQSVPKPTVFDFADDKPNTPSVLIKHKTGSKTNQTERIDFTRSRELLIGRDPGCTLAYDENTDESVSRKHARIVRDSSDPGLFTIENLGNNGTFVNDHKIDGPTPLSHGSTVKFGRSGPSFVFEIDPPPKSKPTMLDLDKTPRGNEPWWVRKPTLADSVSEDNPLRPSKIALLVSVALLIVIVGAALILFITRPKDATSILESNAGAVVSIDASWRLSDPESGRQAYHWYVQYPVARTSDAHSAMLKSATRLPVFVRLTDGAIEPVLILDDEKDTNRPIGGRVFGSGSIVQENGFILTNGSIAAAFNRPYTWPNESAPALLIDLADHSVSQIDKLPAAWIPSLSRFVITRRSSIEDIRMGRVESNGHRLEGKLDVISVGFSGSDSRTSAKLVGMSVNNRMALLKIDPLRALHSAVINDTRTHLGVGDRAYLLGYNLPSGTSNNVSVRLASVIKIEGTTAQTICPGCLEISDSGADAGFSGGPVFDEHGRFAGVSLSEAEQQQKVTVMAVVPIAQGADLLGVSKK